MHNFILGLRFNELFRNETRYLFFYLFYSPLELDWNRKNCSNAEQKSHCRAHNYQRALVYNFGRKCKASFGSNYHKDHNTQGSFKIEAETGETDQLRTQRTFEEIHYFTWENNLFSKSLKVLHFLLHCHRAITWKMWRAFHMI